MPDPLAIYSFALALAVLLTLSLALLGAIRRRVSGAEAFVGLVLAGAAYAFGSFFEIRADSLASLGAWLTVEYLGIATVGPCWLLLTLSLADRLPAGSRRLLPALFAFPLLVILLVATNPAHRLFYSSMELATSGPFVVPRLGKGPFYWLNFAYMNACIAAGAAAAFSWARSARGAYRRQARVVFAGCLIPWAGMALYQLGLSPWGLDIAPFGVAFSAPLYAWGLFRYNLLDLTPVIHENIFEGMRDGVLVLDDKQRIVGANPALRLVLPELEPARLGAEARLLLEGRTELLALLAESPAEPRDLSLPRPGGVRWYAVANSPMRDRKGNRLGTIWTFSDVSARVELAARLETLASTDPLTGILNRRAFLKAAERELARARRWSLPLALAAVDLDHFKAVNDRYGHEAGDAVLVSTVDAIRARLRDTDLFCRSGGEEFLVLMPNASEVEGLGIAERLRLAVRETVSRSGGAEIRITISIGLAFDDRRGADVEELMREADEALYRAKAAGRDRVERSRSGS